MTVFLMLRRVVSYKLISVSEVLTAAIIRFHRPDDGDTLETSVSFYENTRRYILENKSSC
jgi:hypothetical protein